jgi:hypothetical protein
VWPGELDPDIEMNSDSDDDDDAIKEDSFGKDDVRELEGCVLGATVVDRQMNQAAAKEYVPGGNVVITLKVQLFEIFDCCIITDSNKILLFSVVILR